MGLHNCCLVPSERCCRSVKLPKQQGESSIRGGPGANSRQHLKVPSFSDLGLLCFERGVCGTELICTELVLYVYFVPTSAIMYSVSASADGLTCSTLHLSPSRPWPYAYRPWERTSEQCIIDAAVV